MKRELPRSEVRRIENAKNNIRSALLHTVSRKSLSYNETFQIVISQIADIYDLTFLELIDLLGQGISTYAQEVKKQNPEKDMNLVVEDSEDLSKEGLDNIDIDEGLGQNEIA
jgi:adenylyl- and sulfurtransferase ThiI